MFYQITIIWLYAITKAQWWKKGFQHWLDFVFLPNNAHISECVLNKYTCIVVENHFNELFA